jgi:PAS domain S-box-containing protein
MENKSNILIVDDDEGMRQTLELILKKEDYQLATAGTGETGLALAREQFFNIALLDIRLPDVTGTDLLPQLKKLHPDMEILLITGYATLESAMQAVAEGAYHYFIKPLNMDEVSAKIKEALDKQHLVMENKRLYQATLKELTERERAEEALRRRNRELTLLNQVIAASAASLDPESILETACRELALAFEVSLAVACLPNEKRTAMVAVAEYLAESQPSLLNTTIPIADNPMVQHLLTTKVPISVDNVQDDSRLAQNLDLLRQYNATSVLIVPLTIEEEIIGTLNLSAPESRSFSTEEIDLVWRVAEQVSGALARTRLDKERRQLSTAIEQTAESVIITDTKGTIVYANPTFERVTGYSRAEAIGQNPRLLSSGKQDADFYEKLWGTITAGKVWHGRFVNKKKDGTLYTEEATISPVRNENGDIVNYVGLQRDVTRELELEEQYRSSQRMEAVGQLTGGIAHDFNNLLTAINGFAELMQFRLSPEDPLQDLVDNILQSGQRAADLVSQLLAFSRKQIIEPKVLNLNTSVSEMSTMLQRIIGEDIELEVVLTPELWPVKADPARIEQVIVNLAVNARDAMPDGGRLLIEIGNIVLDDEYVANHMGTQPGKYILLAISDTGIGMTEEEKARIFEPFFTTKEVGKGTGLGLATVFGIVKQNGGNIWVYSEKGHGSTFKIYLPCADEPATTNSPAKVEVELPTGDETILLVEDDTGVRDLARQILQRQGYTLLEAKDGEEALELFARYSGPIHLLLTDVIMPGMNGKTLADQLLQSHSDLKTLFMSGYTDNAIVHHGVLNPDVTFLQKPFTSLILTHQVRTVLDG